MDEINLLTKVLEICRCKSSIPNQNWIQLKGEIKTFLKGKSPSIAPVFKVSKANESRVAEKMQAEINRLNRKIEASERLIKSYKLRESQIWTVLKSSHNLNNWANFKNIESNFSDSSSPDL